MKKVSETTFEAKVLEAIEDLDINVALILNPSKFVKNSFSQWLDGENEKENRHKLNWAKTKIWEKLQIKRKELDRMLADKVNFKATKLQTESQKFAFIDVSFHFIIYLSPKADIYTRCVYPEEICYLAHIYPVLQKMNIDPNSYEDLKKLDINRFLKEFEKEMIEIIETKEPPSFKDFDV
jgi:hypothetical protein